jgi:glucan phosphoethanolaminetransferase (alkaline phosphatase superfamily)
MKWRWIEVLEPYAMIVVWIFGMLMAIVTIINVLPRLPEKTALTLLISLIIFLVAVTIVFIGETYRKFTK